VANVACLKVRRSTSSSVEGVMIRKDARLHLSDGIADEQSQIQVKVDCEDPSAKTIWVSVVNMQLRNANMSRHRSI
jgi:hypothetical protein